MHGPLVLGMLHPAHARRKDTLLALYVQLVPANHLDQLVAAQRQKLVPAGHLREVLMDVPIGGHDQLRAAQRISELPDAQHVLRVKLSLQKLGTRITDLVQLQERSTNHQALHVLGVDLHHATVREVDQCFEREWFDLLHRNLLDSALGHIVGEHCVKVGNGGRQYDPVR
uniref:Uncharacterized protein n=1 Tax=Anopheles triannulatus TaxID=58253 RepID=A0A2M4AVY9_9DIPT